MVHWSTSAETLYGWSADEAVGERFEALVPTRVEGDRELGAALGAADLHGAWRGDLQQQHRDGHSVDVDCIAVSVDSPDGAAFVLACRDVSAERERLRELEATARRAAQINDVARELSLGMRNADSLPRHLADAVVDALGGTCAVGLLGRDDPTMGHMVALSTDSPAYREALQTAHARASMRVGEGMIGRAVALRQTLVTDDLPSVARESGAKLDHLGIIERFRIQHQVAVPLMNAEGGPLGVVVAHRFAGAPAFTAEEVALLESVTDLAGLAIGNAALQEELASRNRQLSYMLDEMQAFSYSFAHDLRTPLRAIASLTEVMLDEHGGELDPDAVDLMQRVSERAAQTHALVDQLLNLSRLSGSTPKPTLVELSTFAHEIIAELAEGHPERRVRVEIEPGLVAQVDPEMARALLLNLLQNAWKFTQRREDARIEFRADGMLGGLPAFLVRDNGAGFDARYTQRMFQPFQRLHDAREFPGVGVGLATVARIVRRHGGTIEAEGAPGEGAAFRFSLPPA